MPHLSPLELARRRAERESLERALLVHLRAHGLPEPVPHFHFVPGRRLEFDFAWPLTRVGLEVQGGIGRRDPSHSSPSGIRRDIEKNNLSELYGWHLLQAHSEMVHSGEAALLVKRLFDRLAAPHGGTETV